MILTIPVKLQILRVISKQPDCCAVDISRETGRVNNILQPIRDLYSGGFISVSGTERRETLTGGQRSMNLYRITNTGKSLMQIMENALNWQTPGARSQIALPGSMPGRTPHDGIAERRVESVYKFEKLVPEKPTGRGYVPRPIRSIMNM